MLLRFECRHSGFHTKGEEYFLHQIEETKEKGKTYGHIVKWLEYLKAEKDCQPESLHMQVKYNWGIFQWQIKQMFFTKGDLNILLQDTNQKVNLCQVTLNMFGEIQSRNLEKNAEIMFVGIKSAFCI